MQKVSIGGFVLALVMAFALSSCGKAQPGASNSEVHELRQQLQKLRTRLSRLHQAKTGTTHVHVRFESAPFWFAESRRSLFSSLVVFPKEAKVGSWVKGSYECPYAKVDGPTAVHPSRVFHSETLKPFLDGLALCGDESRPVRLQAVGFASTSGLTPSTVAQGVKEKLAEKRDRLAASCSCCSPAEESDSDAFNLIIANLRAKHTADMVGELINENGAKGQIVIEPHQWCRHSEMVAQRHVEDGGPENYDTNRGLMNRRVELRVLDLPGCMNLDPARRIPLSEGSQSVHTPAT